MIGAIACVLIVLSLASYFLPLLLGKRSEQNLKLKYKASWAFVSGGSSGIGLALVEKLARQGVNVVIAALDDRLMAEAREYLAARFPDIQFRFVPVDLGAVDPETYMRPIREATQDLPVSLVFNNAGYIRVGLFALESLQTVLSNLNCNSVSAVCVTHYFISRMRENSLGGFIAFTSSPGGFMPSPMAPMYAPTKSFITMFASSIAGELVADGIDVSVVHPSPTATGFYHANSKLLGPLAFFQSTAVGPEVIASALFSAAGRCLVVDQGYYTILNRLLLKVIDVVGMSELMTRFVSGQADFSKIRRMQMEKIQESLSKKMQGDKSSSSLEQVEGS